ncbi:IucA/IucC family protein [Salinicola sp. RZ23]|uniref:IucA/IucC family protein n=1 Tax=Salinicola sp. RZ23 TaxID=1949087 RepID=UPI000DA17F0C|nr:IucA/IucC family protein [Salinicola sp. RZ23]
MPATALPSTASVDLAASCFFNALLRECPHWRLVSDPAGERAVLPLSDGELHLHLRHRSASGECRFAWPTYYVPDETYHVPDETSYGVTHEAPLPQSETLHQGEPLALDFASALDRVLATPALVGELDDESRARFRERVLESRINTQESLDARDDLTRLQQGPLDFVAAEQGLLAGHAFHPAPKSRAPFTAQEAQRYCPEHRARIGLAWWAVAPERLVKESSRERGAADLAAELLPAELAARLPVSATGQAFAALPMHPWQARHLRAQPSVQALEAAGELVWLGESQAEWYPTSSHRSLYASGAPWMVKGSLSARLTNSLRLLSVKEVARGLRLDEWMRDLDIAQRFPGFNVMQEPAWLGWRDAEGQVDAASLVLLRENPLQHAPNAEAVVLATLTQQPLAAEGESLLAARVRAAATQRGEPLAEATRSWFAAYCEHVLTPLFGLVVEEGIVLLAHQQNIVLRLDQGWPVGMDYRDCQGSGVSDHFLARHPQLAEAPENHWSRDTLRRYFLYYLLINSTFAVTSALAADGLAEEALLLADLRAHLEGLRKRLDGDLDCLEHALNAADLEVKGNFFCYLSGVNEATLGNPARLYLPLRNPLTQPLADSLAPLAATPNATRLTGALA